MAATLVGRAHDLVGIASYVYVSDQLVSRGGTADISGKNWRREIAVCLPVSEPGFWNMDGIRTLLEQTPYQQQYPKIFPELFPGMSIR
ncbi:hypothetical protein ACFLV0_03365 [Chloroflexota bacterium]